MPNRVLRDTTDSDKVNTLSVHAERFFYRLIMKVDDYGCFFADPRILKAHLYPLQLDQIKETDVAKWVSDCTEAGLLVVYGSGSKKYLEILDFRQSLRQKNRKFPAQADCKQNDCSVLTECSGETKRNESRILETNPETGNEVPPADFDFVDQFNLITGRHFKNTDTVKKSLAARLKKYTPEEILRAVKNCFNDPWHVQNPQYLTPEFILRENKLERYVQSTIIPINAGQQQFDDTTEGRKRGLDAYQAAARSVLAGGQAPGNI